MNQQRECYTTTEGTHVRIYDGRKHIDSIDLPRVDPQRVIAGIIDIQTAQYCFDGDKGLPEEIPQGLSYTDAPMMIDHCIECFKKVDEGRGQGLVTDGLRYMELMGALVAARDFMKAYNWGNCNERI